MADNEINFNSDNLAPTESLNVEVLKLDKIKQEAKELALKSVNEMGLPLAVSLPKSIKTMGSKLKKTYERHYASLVNIHDEKELSLRVANAIRGYWLACHEASNFMRLCYFRVSKNLNETQEKLSTAQGYADYEGWAYTFYDALSDLDHELNLNETMQIMALYWLSEAEKKSDSAEKYDFIAEALDSLSLEVGNYMWDGGIKDLENGISDIRRRAAFSRHKETYELREQAINHWRANIDPTLSNDKAANLLLKVVNLSHRTLSQYVGEAKREQLPPASKA